jgi:hypothetical protein
MYYNRNDSVTICDVPVLFKGDDITTAFCESNQSLTFLVDSPHVIFSHTYWVATISVLKFASIVALDRFESWNQEY